MQCDTNGGTYQPISHHIFGFAKVKKNNPQHQRIDQLEQKRLNYYLLVNHDRCLPIRVPRLDIKHWALQSPAGLSRVVCVVLRISRCMLTFPGIATNFSSHARHEENIHGCPSPVFASRLAKAAIVP